MHDIIVNTIVLVLQILVPLIGIILIIDLFLPPIYKVVEHTIINQPHHVVLDFLKDLRNQDKFNVWVMKDPNIQRVYHGKVGHAGYKMEWESKIKSLGSGEQTITKISKDTIVTDLLFFTPSKSHAKVIMMVKHHGAHQSKVIFEFYGESRKFLYRIFALFSKKMIHRLESKSLKNLKEFFEKQ